VKRTQIYLSEEQHEILRKAAFEQHKSLSHVIRDLINMYYGEKNPTASKKKVALAGLTDKQPENLEKKVRETNEFVTPDQDKLAEAEEVTKSLKGVVSEDRYKQLTSALEEYRKSLEKLSKYS